MSAPTLLFGIGATKAGTSWLHRYLSDHPQCHMRAIKELHYFDAFDFDERDRQRKIIEENKAYLIKRTASNSEARFANAIRQLGHVEHWLSVLDAPGEDIDAYLGYLHGGLEGERVVGDITPAYSLLSADRLRRMSAITGDVRFIYLMRDPVGRLWSHIRMMAKRRADGGETVEARAAHLFRRWLSGKEQQLDLRSDYASALKKLTDAVPEPQRLVMFYEDLFSQKGVTRVCDFLSIDPGPGNFDKRILEGARVIMSADQRNAARARLAEQYEYVAQTMGTLPQAWRQTERV